MIIKINNNNSFNKLYKTTFKLIQMEILKMNEKIKKFGRA